MTSPPVRSSVSVRKMSVDDVEKVASLDQKSFPKPWSTQSIFEEMNRLESLCLVLSDDETDEEIYAYLFARLQTEGVWLLNLNVHPEYRNLSYASQLLKVLVNETVRHEIPKIILEVRESNEKARSFYTKHGFQSTHSRPHFYEDGETAVVMELKTSELSSTLH